MEWCRSTGFWEEVVQLCKLALPICISQLFSFALFAHSTFFVGHIGVTELAAVALGNTWCNVTGFSVGFGLLSSLDTLCSQAFGGKDYKKVGLSLQRGWILSTIACFPISLLWWFADDILRLFGQSAEVAELTAWYSKTMLPGLPPLLYAQALMKYLTAQSIVNPVLIAYFIASVVGVLTSYIVIIVLGTGFAGGASGVVVGNWFLFFYLLIYAFCFGDKGEKTWPGWSWDSFRDLLPMFRLSLSGMLMMCAEWWAYEALVLMTGLIDTTSLDVMTIMLNTTAVFYMVPLGLSVASTTRIGNLLGEGNFEGAELSSKVVIILTLPYQVFWALFLCVIAPYWPRLWTSDPLVLLTVVNLMPMLASQIIPDGFSAIGAGIIRGCGRQALGASANLCSFYLVAIPLGYFLGIHLKYGVVGIFSGIITGVCVQSIVYLTMFFFADFEHEARQVQKTLNEDKQKPKGDESKEVDAKPEVKDDDESDEQPFAGYSLNNIITSEDLDSG